ncbi:MAG: 2OG-Fe(II) oxygenase [Gammaproteobacteria bacterium]|nr:2OG-Fe(II) oxygenase [Gammaproteobacteria bacterium]
MSDPLPSHDSVPAPIELASIEPAPIEPRPIEQAVAPHFVGCWQLANPVLCERLIAFFEARENQHKVGTIGDGRVDETIKRSTDLTISPRALELRSHAPFKTYMDALLECFKDYTKQWPFLGEFLDRVHIGPFNIQRYEEGGHFSSVHSERTSLGHLHRVLAWMTYLNDVPLNDVPANGETEFVHFGLKVRPEAGKTLIWPAEWTHAHRGLPVTGGRKYIITGWMHFPDD